MNFIDRPPPALTASRAGLRGGAAGNWISMEVEGGLPVRDLFSVLEMSSTF